MAGKRDITGFRAISYALRQIPCWPKRPVARVSMGDLRESSKYDITVCCYRRQMPVNMRVINLEENRPTVDEMNRRLLLELRNAKSTRMQILKLIHGYGSSGVGGKLRGAVRVTLEHAKKRGEIRDFVQGEEFRISNEFTWALLKLYPDLKQDRDLGRENRGITMVQL